jgi:hypothetical protein
MADVWQTYGRRMISHRFPVREFQISRAATIDFPTKTKKDEKKCKKVLT